MPQPTGPALENSTANPESDPTANAMRARFLALWSRCGGTCAEQVYSALANRYAEPARHYHTLQHVRRCLRDLDWARKAIPDTDADLVELALWCHDVVYTPGAKDNEQRSAEWFRNWAGAGAGAGNDGIAAVERVTRLILDTSHTGPPADGAGCFAVDIDLAVLGYPHTWFCGDAVRLRAERPDLDDPTYDSAERAFLGTLLARPRIYLTEPFQTRYEARARRNLAWRLAQPSPPWLSPLRETPP